MKDFLRNLRYGARLTARQPGFSALVIATMAVGMTALTATFSLVNAVLLQPLPYPDPERLVSLQTLHPEQGPNLVLDPATFATFAREAHSLESVAATSALNVQVETADGPRQIQATLASPSFFRTFPVRPELGRTFSAADGQPGGPPMALISHRAWRELFSGDAKVLGRAVRFSGSETRDGVATIVGVLPESFIPPFSSFDPQIWIAASFAETGPGEAPLFVFGRLRQGITASQALTELDAIHARLQRQRDPRSQWRLRMVTLRELLSGSVRRPLQLLFVAGLLVLVTATTNTLNLLSARARARTSETAIRAMLGAGRRQVLSQLLAEGALLAALAGGLGLLLAYGALRLFRAAGAAGIPRRFEVGIDWTVLGLVAPVIVGLSLLFALIPAFRLSKLGPADVLSGQHTAARAGRTGGAARFLFVAFQICVALSVAVASALLMRSFAGLARIDPGFEPDGVLTGWISLPETAYPSAGRKSVLYQRLLMGLTGLSEVESAGLVNYLPMSRGSGAMEFAVENPAGNLPGGTATVEFRAVSPGYLETLKIPLRAGRLFEPRDLANPTVIVSEKAARRLWGDRDPLGQRVLMGGEESGNPWMPVVGVVADVRHDTLTREGEPALYVPLLFFSQMAIAARTRSGDAAALVPAFQRAVREVDPNLPLFDVQPMERRVSSQLSRMRLSAWAMAALAATTLLLAAMGVYGAIWYTVVERTDEFRVRFALGAEPADILRLVFRKLFPWVAAGLLAGLAGAVALSRSMASLLYGVGATDLATLGAVAVAVGALALLGLYIPARRAARLG